MTLLERVHTATTCLVDECEELRAPDAEVCPDDLALLWRNQLERLADGTYRRRRSFRARDLTSEVVAA